MDEVTLILLSLFAVKDSRGCNLEPEMVLLETPLRLYGVFIGIIDGTIPFE